MSKIYITVDGGVVQGCYSDVDIEVIMIDLDNLQGADENRTNEILELNSTLLNEIDNETVKAVY
ncbi:MAG: hypothetical protein WCS56_02045 [Bacilli bacterium]